MIDSPRQRRASAAGASSPVAREAAEEALAANGSAADAIVAAFFAIAGSEPGGLFAPSVAIVAGAGAVGRAFDGRAAQPGLGTDRPRGFKGAVPLAARAAVPRAPHAMLLLHATFGRRTLRQVVRPGALVARAVGADKRAAFIDRFSDLGAPALASEGDAIFRIAGPLASGLLTEADLAAVRVDDAPALLVDERGDDGAKMRIVLEPWAASDRVAGTPIWVTAVDAHGLVACLAVFAGEAPDGARLMVPEIEVALPLVADPVLRGKERTQPGTIFGVPRSLCAVDGGGDLRLAAAGALPLSASESAESIASAMRERPLEAGLARVPVVGGLLATLATEHDVRVFATGGA